MKASFPGEGSHQRISHTGKTMILEIWGSWSDFIHSEKVEKYENISLTCSLLLIDDLCYIGVGLPISTN